MNELYPGHAKTFSIGFDESGYDEMYYARIAAQAFHSDHTEYYITRDDILNSLPRIVKECEEPFANSSVIPTYFCAKLAHDKGIKTLLGGDGGDEIFGGNARYHQHFADFRRIPSPVVNILHPFFRHLPSWANKSVLRKVNNYLKRARGNLADIIQAYNLFHYIDPEDIFEKEALHAMSSITSTDITQRYLDQSGTSDIIDQYLYHDLKITLMDNDLLKVNRMTQLANVHVRYPFLYPQLLEFTGLIPAGLKVKNGQLRYIFKESFKKLLPEEIIHKTKHGFGLPIVPWMLRPGKLNDLVKDIVFDSRTVSRGLFKRSFITDLYQKSLRDRTPFYGTYLYFIVFFEMWMREHYDQ
jgi:asparagine synthase (glutamine-hydrolysing)